MGERPDRRDVRSTYERIGPHFAKTREYPWPEVEEYLADRSGEMGLDLGCGNGRHATVLADRVDRVLCLDASRTLLGLARDRTRDRDLSRQCSFLQGDAGRLPVQSSVLDVAVYVATLHHLPTRETRVESLRELGRVLDADGTALVGAWSVAHDRFDEREGFDTELEWTLPDGETVDRFYHVYDHAEFDRDLRAGGLSIERSTISSGNCYAVVSPASSATGRFDPEPEG